MTEKNSLAGLARAKGAPLWRQISAQIRDDVLSGRIGAGARLPTENAFAQQFGVNRHTVRRAIADLTEKGLLRADQGRGTFVQENVLDYPIRRRTRFTETVMRTGRSQGRVILATATLRAGRRIAAPLGISVQAVVLQIRAVSELDGRPLGLSETYFEKKRFPDLAEFAVETRSITQALRHCGVEDYFRKTTRVMGRLPSREEAELLKQPVTRPVLVTEAVDIDPVDQPLSFGVTVWAGDRTQLVFDF
ncbi:MAG: phosphonate metabolism transcriptional regulator PhnF [Magnetospiraceae bacterium]